MAWRNIKENTNKSKKQIVMNWKPLCQLNRYTYVKSFKIRHETHIVLCGFIFKSFLLFHRNRVLALVNAFIYVALASWKIRHVQPVSMLLSMEALFKTASERKDVQVKTKLKYMLSFLGEFPANYPHKTKKFHWTCMFCCCATLW